MARIAVVSDTHVPSRADRLPEWVADRVRDADHTIHAGDFDDADAYETVADLAGEQFTAVAGNMDPAELDLPEVATVTVEGVTIVVIHGTATSGEEYVATITEAIEAELDGGERKDGGTAIAVAGHTHELVDDEIAGVRFLNPGSATGASPAETATMLEVEVAAGDGAGGEVAGGEVTDGDVTVTAFEDGEEIEIDG
ncbi:metallophosphoesterase family protein [Halorussus litoreus]|uniref:metallophosphoesterase family protein n=1 Tax=Halorussus litoreus TaxID=1710536 RepID=UPI000E23BB51|nr:metallophosphoesterase family protein [Halorussus litoreus]